MSDLTVDAGAKRTPLLISFWLNPRQTIERIVADRPHHLVLPLITLGGAASAANLLAGYGVGSEIVGWRILLACVVGAGIFAVFNLYVLAVVIGWIGRKMGGVASNDAVRAVFAWGMLPSILGLAVILSMAAGWRIIAPGSEPRLLSSLFDLVNGVCGLWGVVVTLLMLSRVERFGFWRTIVAYLVGSLALAAGLALMVRTFPVSAVQPAGVVHGADLAAGRLCLRGEIPLWLHPFFAAVLAAAVFGAHLRLRSRARRCDRFPPAKG
jgi:signal peptidase I